MWRRQHCRRHLSLLLSLFPRVTGHYSLICIPLVFLQVTSSKFSITKQTSSNPCLHVLPPVQPEREVEKCSLYDRMDATYQGPLFLAIHGLLETGLAISSQKFMIPEFQDDDRILLCGAKGARSFVKRRTSKRLFNQRLSLRISAYPLSGVNDKKKGRLPCSSVIDRALESLSLSFMSDRCGM